MKKAMSSTSGSSSGMSPLSQLEVGVWNSKPGTFSCRTAWSASGSGIGPVVVNFVLSVSSPVIVPELLLYVALATWPALAWLRKSEYGMLLPSSVFSSCDPKSRAATTPMRIHTVHRGSPGDVRPPPPCGRPGWRGRSGGVGVPPGPRPLGGGGGGGGGRLLMVPCYGWSGPMTASHGPSGTVRLPGRHDH